jgi:hypothetical protein
MSNLTKLSAIAAAAASLAAMDSSRAVTTTWSGTPTNGNFSVGANWTGGSVPAAGNTVAFNSSTTTALNNDLLSSLEAFTFNTSAGAYTISGTAVTFTTNGNVINNNSLNVETISLNLDLNAANKNVSGGNTVLTGVISNGTRLQVVSSTAGSTFATLTLSGSAASTYTGQTSATTGATFIDDLSNLAGNTNLISTSSQLNLGDGNSAGSGTFIVRNSTANAASQTMNGLNLATGAAGSIRVQNTGGGTTTLNLGTGITRSSGATAYFDISAAGTSLGNTTLGLTAAAQTATQGIRGYALVTDSSGTGFGANVGGTLVRYTGATPLTAGGSGLTTTAANNYSLAAGGTTTGLSGAATVNSLDVTTSGSAGTLDLGAGTLTVSSGGILTQGNSNLTVQNGQVGASGAEVVVHTIGTGNTIINATVGGGATALTKAGSGVLTVGGTNTCTGTTYVNAGSLYVNGTHTGAGLYVVATGATLGGNGSITTNNQNVNLSIGAKLSPGALGSAGTLTLALGTGQLNINTAVSGFTTGALTFDLGATSDKIVLTSGTLAIGTGGLSFSDFTFNDVGGLTVGTYTLFQTSSAISGTLASSGLSGTFANNPGAMGTLSISGNNVILTVTAVPEPATWGLLGAGLGLLAIIRRRRLV